MKKSLIVVLILLTISVVFNIYLFMINRENITNQSYLEGIYEGGRTYYNYSDDKIPKVSFEMQQKFDKKVNEQ